jgi:hypothetical protein
MGRLFDEDKAVREFVDALLEKRPVTDETRNKYLEIEQEVAQKSLEYANLQTSDTYREIDLRIEKEKVEVARSAIKRYAGDLEGAKELTLEADRQVAIRERHPLFKERVFIGLVSLKHSLRNAGSYIWRKIIIQEGNFIDLKRLQDEKGKDPSKELQMLQKEVVVSYLLSVGLTTLASLFFYLGLFTDKQPIGLVIAFVATAFMGLGLFGGYSNWRLIRNTKNKFPEIAGEEQLELPN